MPKWLPKAPIACHSTFVPLPWRIFAEFSGNTDSTFFIQVRPDDFIITYNMYRRNRELKLIGLIWSYLYLHIRNYFCIPPPNCICDRWYCLLSSFRYISKIIKLVQQDEENINKNESSIMSWMKMNKSGLAILGILSGITILKNWCKIPSQISCSREYSNTDYKRLTQPPHISSYVVFLFLFFEF